MKPKTKGARIAFRVDEATLADVEAARDFINTTHKLRLNITDVALLCVDAYVDHFKRFALMKPVVPKAPMTLGLPAHLAELVTYPEKEDDVLQHQAAEDKSTFSEDTPKTRTMAIIRKAALAKASRPKPPEAP